MFIKGRSKSTPIELPFDCKQCLSSEEFILYVLYLHLVMEKKQLSITSNGFSENLKLKENELKYDALKVNFQKLGIIY
ncbi:hypothetical protein BpHYR1_013150 [Brachionus plicatilis]|uniref:Uncharacterized protein n=1 Tax=Brachionus plicatilis TaxID=10195 RepID=A0A3M7RQQ9_BRAPC|nr:hypothetical protein BpHYR1_013150 [Brachionus plicatilis]